jgi:hypothetical protein
MDVMCLLHLHVVIGKPVHDPGQIVAEGEEVVYATN